MFEGLQCFCYDCLKTLRMTYFTVPTATDISGKKAMPWLLQTLFPAQIYTKVQTFNYRTGGSTNALQVQWCHFICALLTSMNPSAMVEDGTCSLFVHRSLPMNDTDVWVEPNSIWQVGREKKPMIMWRGGGSLKVGSYRFWPCFMVHPKYGHNIKHGQKDGRLSLITA